MAFFEVLDRNGVKYDKEETQKRYDLLIKGLRRDPNFSKELEAFKKEAPMKGGQIPIPIKMEKGDFLGSEARWFIQVMGSPYAQVVIRMLFMVLFFLSYVESIPVFGSILSAALDITLAGGRILIKNIQKYTPLMVSLIPLPYMNLVGIAVAAALGMLLWPLLAMISFSRQDFTSAIESFIRVIPPPIGDAIADTFLDANRTVYRLNEKRKKLVDDLSEGLEMLMNVGNQAGTKIGEGAQKLITTAKTVAEKPPAPVETPAPAAEPTPAPAPAPEPVAEQKKIAFPPMPVRRRGGRFSRKPQKKSKWPKTQKRKHNS
jgi:hypothetical protein